MKLKIDTTTGKPFPLGERLQLARGPATATLQFLTDNVAALLPDGAPIALKLYNPIDPATVIATFAAWQANPAGLLYTAQLNPRAVEALAWLQVPTLLGRVSYGTPNVDSAQFHIEFGGESTSGAAPVAPIVITQPTGPVNYTELLGTFAGKAVVDQVEGFWRVKAPGSILGLQLHTQDAPVGAPLLVDVIKGGVAQDKIATLAAGQKSQETIFGAPLVVAIGDVIQFKPTQVGSTKPGTNLAVRAIVQLQ